MKTKLTFILLSFFISTFLFGQEEKKRKIFFQAEAGASYGLFLPDNNDYNPTEALAIKSKPGVVLGLNVTLKASEKFFVGTGLRILQHGAVLTYTNSSYNGTYTYFGVGTFYRKDNIMITYLELPIFMKIGKRNGLSISLGFDVRKPLRCIDHWERNENTADTSGYNKIEIDHKGTNNNLLKDHYPLELATSFQLGYVLKNNFGIFAGIDIPIISFPRVVPSYSDNNAQTYGPAMRFNDFGTRFGLSYSF